ncbi:MAG: ribonuclease Z [Chryseotalea sp.]
MSLSVTILGSSGALPQHGRFTSAQWIDVQGTSLLIDCGEGAQMQIKKYDISLARLDYIFISHLHGDHYLGLLGLIFTLHLQKRTRPLHIFGMQGLDEIISIQLKYSKSNLHFPLQFSCLNPHAPTLILDHEKFTVTSFPLTHKIPTCGFLIREKPKPLGIDKTKLTEKISLQAIAKFKQQQDYVTDNGELLAYKQYTLPPKKTFSYAYCSDTAWDPNIVFVIKEVDLLYHESTFLQTDIAKAEETMHSTAKQAALIAREAQVTKLLLGHFSARYKDLNELLAEAQEIFPDSALACEGNIFTLTE